MTGASPARPEPPHADDERATLLGFLDYQRATLAWKCAGLDPEQLARRSTPPSTLSLLGIVRHMVENERGWFDRIADAPERPGVFATPERPTSDLDAAIGDPAAVQDAFESWQSAIDESRATGRVADLGAVHVVRPGFEPSTRWILAHMIEEYARHNGHADLLREAIDGAVGE